MPSKTKSSESRSTLDNKLRPHQDELLQLGELAGIYIDPVVFRTLVEFLNMGINPNTITRLLSFIQKNADKKRSTSHYSQHRSAPPQEK